MTKRNVRRFAAVVAVLTAVPVARSQNTENTAQPSLPAETFIPPDRTAIQNLTAAQVDVDSWTTIAGQAAHRLIEEYGAPDEIRPAYLAWDNVGPWTRIVVFDGDGSSADGKDLSLIEQDLNYPLKPAQIAALAAFDKRLQYDARSGLLSSISETEELNFLRMNLADDVAALRKTPEEARAEYDRTVSMSMSGKTSSSMLGLQFPFGVPPQ